MANNGICGVGVAYDAKIGGKRKRGRAHVVFELAAIWSASFSVGDKVIGSPASDPARAKSVHSSDEPNQMRLTPTPRSGPMLDFFKCNDIRHERLMPSTPQDIDRMFYGLLWCRHLAVLIFLCSTKTDSEKIWIYYDVGSFETNQFSVKFTPTTGVQSFYRSHFNCFLQSAAVCALLKMLTINQLFFICVPLFIAVATSCCSIQL